MRAKPRMAERHRVNSGERAKPNFQVERNCGEATRNGQQHSPKGGGERPRRPPRGEQDYGRPIPVRRLQSIQESRQASQGKLLVFSGKWAGSVTERGASYSHALSRCGVALETARVFLRHQGSNLAAPGQSAPSRLGSERVNTPLTASTPGAYTLDSRTT